jgi:hypothetical protein
MASHLEQRRVLLHSRAHWSLPDGLEFAGLAPSQGTETIRIRFVQSDGTKLDLPVTATALAGLAQILFAFRGRLPEEFPAEIDDLRATGGMLEK